MSSTILKLSWFSLQNSPHIPFAFSTAFCSNEDFAETLACNQMSSSFPLSSGIKKRHLSAHNPFKPAAVRCRKKFLIDSKITVFKHIEDYFLQAAYPENPENIVYVD